MKLDWVVEDVFRGQQWTTTFQGVPLRLLMSDGSCAWVAEGIAGGEGLSGVAAGQSAAVMAVKEFFTSYEEDPTLATE